jgi:hypothetical protein
MDLFRGGEERGIIMDLRKLGIEWPTLKFINQRG